MGEEDCSGRAKLSCEAPSAVGICRKRLVARNRKQPARSSQLLVATSAAPRLFSRTLLNISCSLEASSTCLIFVTQQQLPLLFFVVVAAAISPALDLNFATKNDDDCNSNNGARRVPRRHNTRGSSLAIGK